MRGLAAATGLALGCLLVACTTDGGTAEGTTGAEDESSGEPITAPTIVGEVDAAVACSTAGANRVELWATRIGCVDPPPAPCTLPEVPRPIAGESVDCPPPGSPVTLRVELEQAGRYQVEAVILDGDTELSSICYGFAGDAEVLVTEAEIDDNSVVITAPLDGQPCP